jgi:hypothetical protein
MERMGAGTLAVMCTIEEAAFLDAAANCFIRVADRLSPSTALRQLLKGTWLDHSFHPLLTDFIEGPWMAASFLDIFGPPGSSRAARRLWLSGYDGGSGLPGWARRLDGS